MWSSTCNLTVSFNFFAYVLLDLNDTGFPATKCVPVIWKMSLFSASKIVTSVEHMVHDSLGARERCHPSAEDYPQTVHLHVVSSPLQMLLLRPDTPRVGHALRTHQPAHRTWSWWHAKGLAKERKEDHQSWHLRTQMQTLWFPVF